ncbi:MAG: TRASH domain-containing protein [Candidatus Nanohaloarchaea archaeon]
MKCDYCGEEVRKAEGKLLVKTSGKKLFFCSGKCQKNHQKDRKHEYPE